MTIINSYLGGGGGGGIPIGYCQLDIIWNTEDGQNLNGATVSIVGAQSYTATTDSTGNASLLVAAGNYTIMVTPVQGAYTHTTAQVVAESGTSKTVSIFGGARDIILMSSILLPYATWEIKDANSHVAASGSGVEAYKIISIMDGPYTVEVDTYGVVGSKSVTVSESNFIIDISDMFVNLTINTQNLHMDLALNGDTIATNTANPVIKVAKNGVGSWAVSGTVTEQFLGSVIGTYNGGETIQPISTDSTVTLMAFTSGASHLITSTRSVTIPATGKYRIFAIGGGGGSGKTQHSGGGGSGYVTDGIYTVNAGNVTATIGAGGAAGAAPTKNGSSGGTGGATSFGNIMSASGGEGGSKYTGNETNARTYTYGGRGAAGGGKGTASSEYSNTSTWLAYYGDGSLYGGGGGGAVFASMTKYMYQMVGGTSGEKGGDGGSGGSYNTNNSEKLTGTAGASGVEFDGGAFFLDVAPAFSNTYVGGSHGGAGRAGGGGGGWGAKGGNANTTFSNTASGGGGGGGIAGGDGGDSGQHGKGYGSGGAYTSNEYSKSGGGGGGLFNVDFSSLGQAGAPGALIIQWIPTTI